MGTLELTIQVLNISPQVTIADLKNFFSYCGTVESVEIVSRGSAPNKCALVTFRQPYAFQTALLLNETIIGNRKVNILPAGAIQIPITSDEEHSANNDNNKSRESKRQGLFDAATAEVDRFYASLTAKASTFMASNRLNITPNTLNPNSTKHK